LTANIVVPLMFIFSPQIKQGISKLSDISPVSSFA
jgi:hypothetical protein